MKKRIRILSVIVVVALLASYVPLVQNAIATEANDSVEEPMSVTAVAEPEPELELVVVMKPEPELEPELEIAEEPKLTLDYVKEHILEWYTEEEILVVTLMVMAEDLMCHSKTIWSAVVWTVLNRLGVKGFSGSDSITGIIFGGGFDGVTPENMAKEPLPEVREVVIDVFARKVLEDAGAPEEEVGRTLPEVFRYFRNEGFADLHNHFYDDWRGGNEYDPFTAPYNPYEN